MQESGENNASPPQAQESREISILYDNWPNLMFLGLGAWWAWSWLTFSSSRLYSHLAGDFHLPGVLLLYLISTVFLIASLLASALMWRRLTPALDRRSTTLCFGALCTLATLGVVAGGELDCKPLFFASTALTGIGSCVLCLKSGRIYGSVSLSEALIAGGISVVTAAGLYFVGIGLPHGLDIAFIAVLPLVSALLLAIPVNDPFASAVHGDSEALPFKAPERRMFRRVITAACIVAFTAGVAKGITSVNGDPATFATSASISIFVIGLAGLMGIALISRAKGAHGIKALYTILMVAGIAEMFATIFGFNIYYLMIGKECLWLVFFCFIAYMVFKFNFSAIRSFGIAAALYFISSLAGWVIGACVAPSYALDLTVRAGVGVGLAALVMLTLLFVLTESDVRGIVEQSFEGMDVHHQEQGIAVAVGRDAVDLPEEGTPLVPEDVATDDLSRARDPLYGLSNRELEVLGLFAQGRSANWIADHFVISKNTVRTHLRNAYAKLGVHTRQELLDFLAGGEPAQD